MASKVNTENKHEEFNRKGLLYFLISVKKILIDEFGPAISAVYVHGSLINNKGKGFSSKRSDIDLLITTKLDTLKDRVEFIENLKDELQKIEGDTVKMLPNREFLPVLSVCVATQFELEEGIHQNRNALDAFSTSAYAPLDSYDPELVTVGKQLKQDLVDENFPAWAILAEAQEFRSSFASPKSPGGLKKGENFKDAFLPLPKSILRNAYLLSCFSGTEESKMYIEDDIAKGLSFIKEMLKNEASTNQKAKDLLNLIETNRPGGKGDIESITNKDLLLLWELLSINAEIKLKERRSKSNAGNLDLAATVVKLELLRIQATTLEAIDTAIILYRYKPLIKDDTIPIEIKKRNEISLYSFSEFDESKLSTLIEEWPEDIEKYLKQKLTINSNYKSECKVGFAGFLHTQGGITDKDSIQKTPILSIRPLTHWITNQFNREIAAEPMNPDLNSFRKNYGKALFKSSGDFFCDCPSGLYIELAVVTSDGMILKLVKNALKSPLAKANGGILFTCGVERAIAWKEHVDEKNKALKIKQAVMDSLLAELFVKESEIRSWNLSAMAVQHAHLNTSLLGVVKLKLDQFKLSSRLNLPNDNFLKVSFMPIKEAILDAKKDKGNGQWHQTALMRVILACEQFSS